MEHEKDGTRTQTDKPKHVTLEVQSLRHEMKTNLTNNKEVNNGEESK